MLVAWRGVGAYLVEAKETAEVRRLPKAKIGQHGMLHLFEMAGMHTLVVIYMSSSAQWTYLDDSDLFRYEVCPASFPMNRPKYDSADAVLSHLLGPIDRSSR